MNIEMNIVKKASLLFLLVLVLPFAGEAQLLKRLGDRAKEASTRALEGGVDKTVNKTSEKTLDKAIDGAFEKKENKEKNKKNVTEEPESEQIKIYTKFDFVPGEKVIYSEDFVRDAVGELPLNWNSNSSGVVIELDDKSKWLQLNQGIYLAGGKNATYGKDYTIEFDVLLNVTQKTGYYTPPLYFGALGSGKEDASSNKFLQNQFANNGFGFAIEPKLGMPSMINVNSYLSGKETFSTGRKPLASFASTLRKVAHYAITVQGTRLRMWINETKVVDVPRAVNVESPINQLYFKTENTGGFADGSYEYLIGNIKVASGYPDTRSKLITEGKFVTTGILFNVNSDQIKPQSYGVIKEIAQALKDNTEVNIKIIGHTDSDGSASSNLILSKKRAEAVKKSLINDFSIEEERLTIDGKGASQPVADNKTNTGKAANRRVEFIKL